MKPEDKKDIRKNVADYPGASIDIADEETVTAKTVEEDVRKLNNNPRNNGNPV